MKRSSCIALTLAAVAGVAAAIALTRPVHVDTRPARVAAVPKGTVVSVPARAAVDATRIPQQTVRHESGGTAAKHVSRAAPSGSLQEDRGTRAAPRDRARVRGGDAIQDFDAQAPARSVLAANRQSVITGPMVTMSEWAGSLEDDVRRLRVQKPRRIRERPEPKMPARRRARLSSGIDMLAQAPVTEPSMAVPLIDFAGMDFNTWGAGWPPDPNGDVGPNHYIQTVNTSIEIFNKDGTKATGNNPIFFDSFFASGGAPEPCASNNNGDPIVVYDRVSGRWIITDFAWAWNGSTPVPPYYECIAVSKTADPVSGGWWLYTFQTHPAYMADYPKLGIWPDAIYMSATLFDSSNALHGARLWALNRADLISGAALRTVVFDVSNDAALLPANYTGALPPAAAPNVFADLEASVIHLWRFHVDWANIANSTFTGPVSVPIASYSTPASIPQPASQTLDPLADRLMMQAQYRRIGDTESLWLNHTVTSGGATGIRWYEIQNPTGTPALHQQSTFQPADGAHRWMGSLAVDGYGNMALGYSVSGSSVFPSIRYTGRAASDPPNTLQAEVSLAAGAGAQTRRNRWGDYSSMSVDPVDDCTFWYTAEYFLTSTTQDNWRTRIGSFRFPGCGAAPTLTGVSPTSGPAAGGTAITLAGGNFVAGATTVTVGGRPATAIAVSSPSSLTATTPAGVAGAVTVTVTTAAGTAPLVDGFTYDASGPAPTLTAVAPPAGSASGGTLITLTGAQFIVGGTTVTVGGNAATAVNVASTSSLTAVTPAGVPGPATVALTTANGIASLAGGFTYLPDTGSVPTLMSVTPVSGPTSGGTTITVTGTNFVIGGTTVTVGGAAATGVNVTGATSLSAVTPAGAAGPAAVVVATAFGSASRAGAFTYTSGSGVSPTIASVTPSFGPTTGGTAITVTGTSFVVGATSVSIGGIPADNVVVANGGSLSAVTPICSRVDTPDPDVVAVTVSTAGGTATVPGGFTCIPPPGIASVTPSVGSVLGGTLVTITGTRFVPGGTFVMVGGTLATNVVVASATSLTAITPAAARPAGGAADVTIVTGGGSASLVGGFMYATPPPATPDSAAAESLASGRFVGFVGPGSGVNSGDARLEVGGQASLRPPAPPSAAVRPGCSSRSGVAPAEAAHALGARGSSRCRAVPILTEN